MALSYQVNYYHGECKDNKGNLLYKFGNWGTGAGYINPRDLCVDDSDCCYVIDEVAPYGEVCLRPFDKGGNFSTSIYPCVLPGTAVEVKYDAGNFYVLAGGVGYYIYEGFAEYLQASFSALQCTFSSVNYGSYQVIDTLQARITTQTNIADFGWLFDYPLSLYADWPVLSHFEDGAGWAGVYHFLRSLPRVGRADGFGG